jgi:putative ABC transport system permease protein
MELNRVRRAFARVRNLLRWRKVNRDLEDELSFHVERSTDLYVRRGLSSVEARRAALRDLGGLDRWTEVSRDTRGVRPLQDLARDVRYALRTFARLPGFALSVTLVLTLGIGATTAVFSVVRGVVLSPLPYADPDELYSFYEADAAGGLRAVSYPTFEDLRAAARNDVELAYVRGESFLARSDDGTLNLLGGFATPEFFQTLGRAPAVGRTFGAAETEPKVAVLSWTLAERLYGGSAAALNQTLTTPGGVYTVIGVMPRGFGYPVWADLWLPLEGLPADARFVLQRRNLHVDASVIARIPKAVALERAEGELSGLVAALSEQYPEPGASFDRARLEPLTATVMGSVAPRFLVLLASVVLVLVIACVNVASLMLARGSARARELAVRLALGASRARIARQLLTESLLLSLIGAGLGSLLAWATVVRLRSSMPTLLPRMQEITVDGRVLAFALALSLLCAIGFGSMPALRATRTRADYTLRGSGSTAASDRASVRLRSALVCVQVALSVVLLVGALMLIRTAAALSREDLGFQPEGLITIRVIPPREYAGPEAALALYERLRAAAAAVPSIRGAALTNHIPLGGAWVPTAVRTARTPGPDERFGALFRTVSPEYLELLGARLRAGRQLTPADRHGPGIIVNRTLAEREWPGQDPIGQSITVFHSAQGRATLGKPMEAQVVGVIEDIREFGPDNAAPAAVYVPHEWDVWPNTYLLVRSSSDPATVIPALRAVIQSADPDIPTAGPGFVNELRSYEDYRTGWVALRTFAATLLTGFAAVALVLSLVGLFAVMAYVVAQRRAEIAMRIALGARPSDAAAMVMKQAGMMVGVGLMIGIAAAVPATRLLESVLFGVERSDVTSYVVTVALFILTALAAAYLPARRAARVDPMRALRVEA